MEAPPPLAEAPPPDRAPAKRPGAIRRLYHWVLSWAETPYGTPALFGIAFLESSFFPIPPDVLQIALSVSRPRRSFVYALVATAGSVLGGILGWWLGMALWGSLQDFFFDYVPGFTRENFAVVERHYADNAFVAIFSAAFTPIPFKVFTICSGVFGIALPTLLAAAVLGRGARFLLVGSAIFFFGPRVKDLLERYFEWITFGLLAVGIAGFLAVRFLF
jgi:membrane protein YqaA with SNARE-associated domain